MIEREQTAVGSRIAEAGRTEESPQYPRSYALGPEGPRARLAPARKFFGALWRGWLKVAEVIGTFQMMVILSLVYWTVLAATAVPFKLLADPLRLRSGRSAGWVKRAPVTHTVDTMRQQY